MTGLLNRTVISDILESEIEKFKRYGRASTIILFDLDGIKSINDIPGHLEGDRVLQKISALLKLSLRKSDYSARWGCDEFLIRCPETCLTDAFEFANDLRGAIMVIMSYPQIKNTSALFGITEFNSEDKSIKSILSRVDRLLYKSKESGKK